MHADGPYEEQDESNHQEKRLMKMRIVEDDVASRYLMSEFLQPYGVCHVAVDGQEAVESVRVALDKKTPYDLICLDIRMPRMNGLDALKQIRLLEEEKGMLGGNGAKVIMTTTADDSKSILSAFNAQCEGYVVKPVSEEKLLQQIQKLGIELAP